MPTVIDSSVQMHQSCIDACNKCMQACEECLISCLQEPDVQARIKCISILRDCADICAVASQFMARNSPYAMDICNLCAEICEDCAQECAMFQDEHCQKCADACRACAMECHNMASMAK